MSRRKVTRVKARIASDRESELVPPVVGGNGARVVVGAEMWMVGGKSVGVEEGMGVRVGGRMVTTVMVDGIYTYIYGYIHKCVHMHICMCIYTCMYIYTIHIYVCIYVLYIYKCKVHVGGKREWDRGIEWKRERVSERKKRCPKARLSKW